MADGTGLKKLRERFPDRYFDVGDRRAARGDVCCRSGRDGRPVAAIYSTFLQRAFDQVVHDVCVQSLHVTFCLDRAGIVGEDGQTQHGVFDIRFLRPLPNMSTWPRRTRMNCAICSIRRSISIGPVAVRYPRGKGLGVALDADLHRTQQVGKAELLTPEEEVGGPMQWVLALWQYGAASHAGCGRTGGRWHSAGRGQCALGQAAG